MDLVFWCEINGFQFHTGPFILKQIVLNPVQAGPPTIYTFDTAFLLDEPEDAQQTYCYTTRNFHSLFHHIYAASLSKVFKKSKF